MNISSFNITDVGYHYIGLRVLSAMPDSTREEQNATISRNVLKYARDKALRLMLPEPKSSYETIGEKVCQELAHFEFASPRKGRGYEVTPAGQEVLRSLGMKRYADARRSMTIVHLRTYANLQAVVHSHIARMGIWSPSVEAGRPITPDYVTNALKPSLGDDAAAAAEQLLEELGGTVSPKQLEDRLRERVLRAVIQGHSIGVPLFRAMSDRLVSLRLLNGIRKATEGVEFYKTYSPCRETAPLQSWHHPISTLLSYGGSYTIYLSEPDFRTGEMVDVFLGAIDQALSTLPEQAGYSDLPDVRDLVCEMISIPEAAFDEGVLVLLEQPKPPITLGLTYDRISGRRKPLVRPGDSAQIYNLIRRS